MLILTIEPGAVINRIDRWLGASSEDFSDLDELQEQEISGARYSFFRRRDDVHVGMEVTIARRCHSYDDDWNNTWVEEMDDYIGQSGIVTSVSHSGIFIPGLTSNYHWPWRGCVPATKQKAFSFYYNDPLYGVPLAARKLPVTPSEPRLIDTNNADILFLDGKVVEKKKADVQPEDENDLLAESLISPPSRLPWRVYPEDLRDAQFSSAVRDDLMDAVRFNAMYQTDFINRITGTPPRSTFASNSRSALSRQIRQHMSESMQRQVYEALTQVAEQHMHEGIDGVERRVRVAVMEPLQINNVRLDAEQMRFEAEHLRPCPTTFQVVFNGRDIVRIVD